MYIQEDTYDTNLNSINLMPLVDIFGALMIVFIISMPIMLSGIDINLPKHTQTSVNIEERENKKIIIAYRNAKQIYLNDEQLRPRELLKILQNMNKKDVAVLLYADQKIEYGLVINLFSNIKKLGYTNITLVTQTE
jgi:biopolymer transport protein TolR